MTLVIDASVVIKWALPEPQATEARRLLSSEERLIAPALLPIELANVLWKRTHRGDLDARQATEVLARLVESVTVEPQTVEQVEAALSFALRYDRSVYDSLYVVLALAEDCQFVTADRRLYNALVPVFPGTMLWVEDIPVL